MRRFLITATAFFALSFSGATLADCHLDGRVYKEGAVVAGYVCKGGSWQEL